MYIKFFLLITLSLLCKFSFAQSGTLPNKDIYFPSVDPPTKPQTSNLFTFNPYEVDKTSGTVNINIPFYTIKVGNITLPVGISYRTTGIRVWDIASGVGLGWQLNASYCVTVSEEYTHFRYNSRIFKTATALTNAWNASTPSTDEIYRSFNGYIPSVRTIYTFNCGAYNVSFLYDDNKNLKFLTPEKNIKITTINASTPADPTFSGNVNGFKIITPDGLEYILDKKESYNQTISMDPDNTPYGLKTTAYWVSRITDLSTGKSIGFQYQQKTEQIHTSESTVYTARNIVGSQTSCNLSFSEPNRSVSYQNVQNLQLTEIGFPEGKIKIITEDSRPEIDKTKINALQLVSGSNVIREMVLQQSYFGSQRLKLDSITIYKNPSEQNDFERYKFKYDSNDLPSYNQVDPVTGTRYYAGMTDYWGYYNGSHAGPLVPIIKPIPNDPPLASSFIRDYSVNPTLSKACVLKAIVYPTGGTANFEYENHIVAPLANSLTDTLGGLRIKSISYAPLSGNMSAIKRTFKYLHSYRLNKAEKGMYYFRSKKYYSAEIASNDPWGGPEFIQCADYYNDLGVYSDPLVPWVYHNGSPVFYDQVEDDFGTEDLNNGRILTNYLYTDTYNNDLQYTSTPQHAYYKYIFDASYTRGQILSQNTYDNANILKQKDVFNYQTTTGTQVHAGILVTKRSGGTFNFPNDSTFEYTGPNANVNYHTYDLSTGKPLLSTSKFVAEDLFVNPRTILTSETKSISFNNTSNDSLQNDVKYFYDNNDNNITRIESILSDGRTKKMVFKYLANRSTLTPAATSSENAAFGYLSDANRSAEIIQKEEYIDGVLLVRTRNFYETAPYDSTLGKYIARISQTKQSVFKTGQETSVITSYMYDSHNNIVQSKVDNNLPQASIYDEYGKNIIATSNGAYNDIGYTSFEENAKGRWIYDNNSRVSNTTSVTGTYLYNLSSSHKIQITVGGSKRYIVSYWSQGGQYSVSGNQTASQLKVINGWTLYRHVVQAPSNNIISISGSGKIDELRVYPENSTIDTYTLSPFVGITSHCDPNSFIEYYKYDGLGRLITVVDENGHVIKKICYNYYGQATNCGANRTPFTAPIWRATGVVRCVQSQPGYNTGDQEREEIDNNPESTTHGQTRWVNTGANVNACPIGNINPDWQYIGNSRCSTDPYGYVEHQEADNNPLSPSYGTLRWNKVAYDTLACPIPRNNFTVTNSTYHDIYVTVKNYATGLQIGVFQVHSQQTKVIASLAIDYYSFSVSDGNSPSASFKLYIQDNLQPTTNNTLPLLHVNSPLTLKVELQ